MGFLRSKSKSQQTASSQSQTSNRAYDTLSEAYSPILGTAGKVNSALSDLLGLNGGGDAFANYRNSTGYDFMFNEGSRAITNNRAAGGLLNSGGTLKALTKYGQNTGAQYFNQYLAQLMGLRGGADQAANILAGAGGTSSSSSQSQGTSTSREGLGGLIGGLASAAAMASDRRLKKDVKKVGKLANGINVYEYKYLDNSGPFIGVMADEVAEIQPEALGPTVRGYMSVDYSKLDKAV
jgi:hypothetical protein